MSELTCPSHPAIAVGGVEVGGGVSEQACGAPADATDVLQH